LKFSELQVELESANSKFTASLTNTLNRACDGHSKFLFRGNYRQCKPELHNVTANEYDKEERGAYGQIS